MSQYPGYISAGAEFEDSGFWEQDDADNVLMDNLLQSATCGDGYNAFSEAQVGHEQDLGGGFFDEAFVQEKEFEDSLKSSTPPPSASNSPASSEAFSTTSSASLAESLDDDGLTILRADITTSTTRTDAFNYTPDPLILANQPPAAIDPSSLYAPLTTSCFKTSAAAALHRTRARLAPKSQATDIAKVKAHGRDYWVVRIYNAMINSANITDGGKSVHRVRFTKKIAFEPLDLEAAAHAVFDEAIAVHERGWNRPRVYHKHTVRGKLVDISGGSVELRLSRICLVLSETKSAVDDAVRGGVTLALLCDNPEARRFTKESNNVGNQKRGERLKATSSKAKSKAKKEEAQDDEEVEDAEENEIGEDGEELEPQELVGSRELSVLQEIEE
ncbi:hypothetical protein E8E11_010294 [Didymella keratinophila]|nr:hypothetical protein E8E11_010294 [Didymella keratinophila]